MPSSAPKPVKTAVPTSVSLPNTTSTNPTSVEQLPAENDDLRRRLTVALNRVNQLEGKLAAIREIAR